MVRALERGLTVQDFETMTIGMIMDYIITYNNLNDEENNDNIAEATQADFDDF